MQRQIKIINILTIKIMALLTKKQAVSKIYRLAKTLAEISDGEFAATKTEIELHINDCKSGDILYISKWDGLIMSIKPMFESQHIKIKVLIVDEDKYILDIK